MSKVHRPDFDALRQQRSLWALKSIRNGAKHRDAYLFPHINLEDLSNTKNLLLFIESRARNVPEAFAWSDSQHIRLAASADAVKIIESGEYTMMVRVVDSSLHLFSFDRDMLQGLKSFLEKELLILRSSLAEWSKDTRNIRESRLLEIGLERCSGSSYGERFQSRRRVDRAGDTG